MPSLPRRSPRTGRPTKEEAAQLHEHILQQALQEFVTNGFEAARMDRIATSARISKRTLYARYASKDELVTAALNYGVAKHIRPVRALPAQGPVRERLAVAVHELLAASLTREGLGIRSLVTWVARHRPDLRENIRSKTMADATGVVRQILEEPHAKGEIASSDFPRVAEIVFYFLISLPHHEMLGGMFPEVSRVEDVQLDQALDFVMAALHAGVAFSEVAQKSPPED